MKNLLRGLWLAVVLIASPAEAAFLGKLSDHPTMSVAVSAPFETAAGAQTRSITLSWTHRSDGTDFNLSVARAKMPLPDKNGLSHELPSIGQKIELFPVGEIFEMMKSAEASMPAFDSATVTDPDSRATGMSFREGESFVEWALWVKPDSKSAKAIRKLYDRLWPLLNDEQKAELEKAAVKPPVRPVKGPNLDIGVTSMEEVSRGAVNRDIGFGLSEQTGKNGRSSGGSFLAEKDSPPGESHPPEKSEGANLPKWPGAELSKLLSVYVRDAKLGEKQPGAKLDASKGPYIIVISSGEGRFLSQTNTCSAAARVEAWMRLRDSMAKMLSPKQIAAMEAPWQ